MKKKKKEIEYKSGKNKIKYIFKTFILKTNNREEVKNLRENTSLIDIMNCWRVTDYLLPMTCQILCRLGADKN